MSRQIKRHTLRHKIFNVEIPQALLVIAGIGADMPHTGLRPAVRGIIEAIEAVLRLDDNRARHLSVRAQYVEFNRLGRKRFTVAVAQQTIEDHRFAVAIEIARAKHKELLAVARGYLRYQTPPDRGPEA